MSNFRSPKLLDCFRDAPICFGCGRHNDGSVVAAHANWSEYGKGMSIKAHDWAVAGLCRNCHSELDFGIKMKSEERKEFWRSAHIKTMAWLFANGKLKAA